MRIAGQTAETMEIFILKTVGSDEFCWLGIEPDDKPPFVVTGILRKGFDDNVGERAFVKDRMNVPVHRRVAADVLPPCTRNVLL